MFITRLNPHPITLARPSTLKVLRARERTLTLSSIVSTFGLTFESFKECGGASLLHPPLSNHHNIKNEQLYISNNLKNIVHCHCLELKSSLHSFGIGEKTSKIFIHEQCKDPKK
jgi:hypothetical protein